MIRLRTLAWILLLASGAVARAAAQIGVPGVPLPQLPGVPLPAPVTETLRNAQTTALSEARKLRIRELLRTERETVEADPDGQPILRRQVGALSPAPEVLAAAQALGFTVLRSDMLDGLGLRLVVLQAPDGMSTRRALKRLRKLDPAGSYDFVHLYLGGGDAATPAAGPRSAGIPAAAADAPSGARRIGLIDSGVDASHPALAGVSIERSGCDGAAPPGTHGTAVASLLVGNDGEFHGVLPGARLYAADIFCGHGGGSIALLAIALDWMARERVAVVNISLVGAKSVLLTGLVRAMTQRGHLLVAAVGNDGPSAPPLYPAAYPDVVGVTGVDREHRVLPEACRGEQVDFAAPGADIEAADLGGGFGAVRGTSFATPIVAGLLARELTAPDVEGARAALARLASQATDLGRQGVDTTYGNGLVGAELVKIVP